VLNFSGSKKSIDTIRQIGNGANHKVASIAEKDARLVMQCLSWMLQTVYSMPV
jgi:hypothetical protein